MTPLSLGSGRFSSLWELWFTPSPTAQNLNQTLSWIINTTDASILLNPPITYVFPFLISFIVGMVVIEGRWGEYRLHRNLSPSLSRTGDGLYHGKSLLDPGSLLIRLSHRLIPLFPEGDHELLPSSWPFGSTLWGIPHPPLPQSEICLGIVDIGAASVSVSLHHSISRAYLRVELLSKV